MLEKWSDMLQNSLGYGKPWFVEQNAYELQKVITRLHRILLG